MAKNRREVKPNEEAPLKQAAEGLAQLAAVLREEGIAEGVRARLSAAQARVLALLREAPQGMRLSEIAQRLGVSAASTSDTVAGLVSRKLVRRAEDPDDARAQRLLATAKARTEAVAKGRGALHESLSDLGPPDLIALQRVLVRLILNLQRRGRIPIARACVNCRFFKPNAHRGQAAPHHCDYVNAAFGDAALRVLCAEFEAAEPGLARENQDRWQSASRKVVRHRRGREVQRAQE